MCLRDGAGGRMAVSVPLARAGIAAIPTAVAFVAAAVAAAMLAAILLAILAGRFGRACQFFGRCAVKWLSGHQRLRLVFVER